MVRIIRVTLTDYWFRYDWRLNPLKTADLLDEYINGILAVTKKGKVCITSDCLGSVLMSSGTVPDDNFFKMKEQ
ncbi:MAG: hypothetical protein MJ177_08525 [Clostridia bacterium]|nr:hypothetical protein [Clostridia bacterium]